MIFIEEINEFILSNGKRFYAYEGTLGLHPQYGLTYGYDGQVSEMSDDFTKEERAEIADYMIKLWTQFKEKD